MDFLERFFGRGTPTPGGEPVANPALETPLTLQLLFEGPLELESEALTSALRAYHPELAEATVELLLTPLNRDAQQEQPENDPTTALTGLFAWEKHVVRLLAFDMQLPAMILEKCIRPAHYDDALKQLAFEHTSHALLYYGGYETDPLEQYVALCAVAATLARFGAVIVLNEAAHTSIPAAVLLPHEEDDGDMLTALRTLPIPFFYGGFVKLEVENQLGVWMRTYGNSTLGLPDLAYHAMGHNEGTFAFNAFANILGYLRETGRTFAPGDTLNVGEGLFFRMREPAAVEWYLESLGEMLVCDSIPASEANL